MRKMKKLFRIRDVLAPLFHWSEVHFAMNTLCLIAFMIALCFTGITQTMSVLFITCMAQYLPIFIIMAGKYALETVLSKKTIAIIKTKLEESKISFHDVNITIEDFTIHSCVLCIANKLQSLEQSKELLSSIRELNRKFGHRYNIAVTLKEGMDNYA